MHSNNTERGDQLPHHPPSFVEFHNTGAMREVSPILGGAEGKSVHDQLFGKRDVAGMGTPGQRPSDALFFNNVTPLNGSLAEFLGIGKPANLANPFGLPEGKDATGKDISGKLRPVVPGDAATTGDTARPRKAERVPHHEAEDQPERVHRVAHRSTDRAYHPHSRGHHRADSGHHGDGGHHRSRHHGDGGAHHRHGRNHGGGEGHHHQRRRHGADAHHKGGRHHRGEEPDGRAHAAEPLQGTTAERAQKIMSFLQKELHLTKAQAAGVLGNFIQEGANLDPGKPGDGGNAIGIAQWNGPRRKELAAYAKEHGTSATNLDTQLSFLKHELTHKESGAYKALLKTTTPEQAANTFSRLFERAGNPMNHNRRYNARMAYNNYGNTELAEN